MKKYLKNSGLFTVAVALLLSMASCEKDNVNPTKINTDETYKAILKDYVDDVVIPTYKDLAEAALAFRNAVNALNDNNDALHLKAAADAWMTARIFWEESEAFLFGPVSEDAFDIDAHIDSWPLELIDIQAVLDNDAAGLTGEAAWLLDAEVIGFHTTEYLLFREGQARGNITDAELKYLTAATDALVWDCALAYAAWAGESNISTAVRNALNENSDVKDFFNENVTYQNFGGNLKNATGLYGGSFADAISEISDGAADIADEVGTTKIESPYLTRQVLEVESWYSWHSLEDYQNNIKSIRNAYFGERIATTPPSTPKANSLSAFVATKNPQLDTQIKAKIEDCIAKIQAIGTGGKSFYEVVRDHLNTAQVEAAVDACDELGAFFNQISNNIIE
ncbi:MAG: hypothetical protein LBH30_07085 [Prevotellaceae bacterium]|jgi:uncharacterized iron-regulated protein|nr:hypothetical protein [Prevotellaceae bacterium]